MQPLLRRGLGPQDGLKDRIGSARQHRVERVRALRQAEVRRKDAHPAAAHPPQHRLLPPRAERAAASVRSQQEFVRSSPVAERVARPSVHPDRVFKGPQVERAVGIGRALQKGQRLHADHRQRQQRRRRQRAGRAARFRGHREECAALLLRHHGHRRIGQCRHKDAAFRLLAIPPFHHPAHRARRNRALRLRLLRHDEL